MFVIQRHSVPVSFDFRVLAICFGHIKQKKNAIFCLQIMVQQVENVEPQLLHDRLLV